PPRAVRAERAQQRAPDVGGLQPHLVSSGHHPTAHLGEQERHHARVRRADRADLDRRDAPRPARLRQPPGPDPPRPPRPNSAPPPPPAPPRAVPRAAPPGGGGPGAPPRARWGCTPRGGPRARPPPLPGAAAPPAPPRRSRARYGPWNVTRSGCSAAAPISAA